MAEATEIDMRQFVHERFNKVDAKLDRLLAEFGNFGRRLTSVEERMTELEKTATHGFGRQHERIDVVQKQLDGIGERLERIEARLDLTQSE